MEKELKLKKCSKCGSIVKVLEDCNCDDCGILCCSKKMEDVIQNSIDASFEKHVPTYKIKGNDLIVEVNHVMEEEHFIKWICLKTIDREEYVYLKPGEDATATFKNVSEGILYSYCNKHGLWMMEIK
ncbi:MAG: desulfoferrodoxin [Bacilli bacterium]|nr:desulfoferrodoxin [Bacilli bacterium]